MTSRNRSRETDGSAEGSQDLPGTGDEATKAPDQASTAAEQAAQPPGEALVRIHDLAGRPRGTGFLADLRGTLITSHEAVDGLARLVLHGAGGRSRVVAADAVTPLPALDLALVRTEGLGVPPLPVTVRGGAATGAYVRIAADGWREARVLGSTPRDVRGPGTASTTSTARWKLAVGTAGRDALRRGGGAAGGPVLDTETGAVVGVLGTALSSGHSDVGFAVPLHARVPGAADPLAELLAENALTVPAYGADLNMGGVLELTGTSVRRAGPPDRAGLPEPVERAAVAAEFGAFTDGPATVLGLVGAPGSGRTTELAALAARREKSGHPTLWLRGSELRDDDTSVADAARRALTRAASAVAESRASSGPADLGDTTPERLASLAASLGRPLLLLLDGPEQMPPALARRSADWTDGTVRWLRETGARLVVACRAEYWEGTGFPAEVLHRPGDAESDPACVPVGDLTEDEAREARRRHGIPENALVEADARHPLTLRLLAEIRAAVTDSPAVTHSPAVTDLPAVSESPAVSDAPEGAGRLQHPDVSDASYAPGLAVVPHGLAAPGGPTATVDRDDVFAAYLDLVSLRIAQRLAAGSGLRGTAVRRLAAKVAGQVHEAARRTLGPGPGDLDREAFEVVFPWGPAPERLGGGTGWAPAVLAEGLLVPAGPGYRFAHEELADWLQGMHLDLDEALQVLVHRPEAAQSEPVPHHRVGPVVQALLYLARQHGTGRLASRLADLVHALDAGPRSWWAARLLTGTLRAVPDATPYIEVLRLLADRIVAWRRQERPVPEEVGPAFWTDVRLPQDTRFTLLRRLVHADGPPCEAGPRFLDAVARLLAADPTAVQPLLARWFVDEQPLPATPHATVATAAQALLHTHRHRALDDLTDALADRAHRRADELLAVLAEEEPSAVCRAVDRWARDERPARRAAAVAHGLRAAPHVSTGGDRALLRYTALTLLARPADRPLHGGALALLIQDPHTRDRYLPRALEHFAAGDPQLPPDVPAGALLTHPEPVLRAFAARLERPDAEEALRALADATSPGLAPRVAALLRQATERRPELAGQTAAYVDQRLDRGPSVRAVLLPLVTGLLEGGPVRLRCALAGVLTPPGIPASRPLRRELRDLLMDREQDTDVLDTLLHAVARNSGDDLRDLVHRVGLLLVRTPEGAARFDRALVDLGRHVPGFAARAAGWLADAPGQWAALVGPSSRRMIENLAGVRVPA
ncbi:large Pro/Ala/Gly-rich protein [Streptomyces viridochromogenes DSM 40736]|uniref:Large Pro/Ala/Gly-rich protein n=1 Tax=Streptomyces viridochromogenes (strain DSM 40736 / JCM 4977 / BCRC 1201 / Tue 494) TaxID=591159 RepID=D9WY27_STRVT|nr:S1C family serine protease [Streptomyces viridochromogenes]EFL35239.1 large Pro/Ala/Gly-rich protein [Streptomyces viridochromogenes DSM 40736]